MGRPRDALLPSVPGAVAYTRERMIILLTGDNVYEIDQELGRLITGFAGEPEQLDVDVLEPRQLTDIFGGLSLFTSERMVILKRASENSALWEALGERADTATDTTIVLVEPKVDKRTKTYKALAKTADARVFTAWGERDMGRAEQWLAEEAKTRDIVLERDATREIVRRRGVEQYQLLHTLEQLALMGDVTLPVVEAHIEATPQENVFELLAAGISGDAQRVRAMIRTLRQSNDPYMTLGLLASQVVSLGGLVLSDKSQAEVASDLGVSPFALRNLSSVAREVNRAKLHDVVSALSAADRGLKSSSVDPWLQIEIALTTRA